MVLFPILLVVMALGYHACHGAKFLLTVPKQPHFDAAFTATVSATGINQREIIGLEYRGTRDRSRLLNSTSLIFNTNSVQTWTVVFPMSKMEDVGEDSIVLTMSSTLNQKSLTLKFSQETGYIFIQTDKPLYAPRQKVRFRIIAVDEYQRLAKYPLKVDIKNEKLIVVDRMRYTALEAFQGQDFELPRETLPGNWSITANFEGQKNAPNTAHSAIFEVKEYVLPRFSASVKVSTDVITRDMSWVSIEISATYVYGRPVAGSASLKLGVWSPKDGVKLLPDVYIGQLVKGKFSKSVRVSSIVAKDAFTSVDMKRLYVNVNVTEQGTKEVDQLEDTTTFIAHPFYVIKHTEAKTHFKPGFPYTLVTQVNAKSGRPASWLKVWTEAKFRNQSGKIIRRIRAYIDLDGDGKLRKEYDVPKETFNITFRTIVIDFKAGFNNDNSVTIPRLPSDSNQYLHMSLARPVQSDADGLLMLRYTPTSLAQGFRMIFAGDVITILILSKGHLVFTTNVTRNTDGLNRVAIPASLYSETSPFMRVVAFYHFQGQSGSEYITDSIRVDTQHACVEELTLSKPWGRLASTSPQKPKDKFTLRVRGGPKMAVGFVAVDQAVFLLNDRHTLTRDSMFNQLATHDQGTGSGDGLNMADVFKNSGLLQTVLDSREEQVHDPATARRLGSNSRDRFLTNRGVGGGMKGPLGMGQPDLPTIRTGGQASTTLSAPPQTVRKYFPESWLFDNHILSSSGSLNLKTTLPDSITTWSFMAVGVSASRGVCVSNTLAQKVQKLFFVDVRLPFKSTRLEVINVKVAIYNHHSYNIRAKVVMTGDEGVCFSANQLPGTTSNSTTFSTRLAAFQSQSFTIKVIPLRNGDLTLRVDVSSQNERDVVEKKLYVVAEGRRVRKSLTFVLDPSAKHATFKPKRRNRVTMIESAMINNLIDTRSKTQRTKIDLFMPREVIRGTEFCKVSAFGDLMGDIINHAVVKSKSLMEHGVQDAEEVIGDLGPTVHALKYANQSELMDSQLQAKGQRFIKHGVARLLKYRTDSAFNLLPGTEKSTWLTAVVLKTLCHATNLTFIDTESLIDNGFYWLLSQTSGNGTLTEKDWRLADDSEDYSIMLTAEVLIALLECDRTSDESVLQLQYQLVLHLEEVYRQVVKPMVLAKVAYALALFDRNSDATHNVINLLNKARRRNKLEQIYWGDREQTNEKRSMPFWYRKGVKASSIEATAYALLTYLRTGIGQVDAVADWLVAQRNDHGSFVGAMDSIAAIQALSSYSLQKRFVKVDLSCNVSFDRQKEFSHSFKFTEKNAIHPELLSNVPVGQSIEVLTKGEGLGQMQVNVEYNVPHDENAECPFNITIEVKNTEINFAPEYIDYPLCMSCNINCPKPEPEVVDNIINGTNCTLYNVTALTDANSTDCWNGTLVNATNATNASAVTSMVDEPRLAAVRAHADRTRSKEKVRIKANDSSRSHRQSKRQRARSSLSQRKASSRRRRVNSSRRRSRKPRAAEFQPTVSRRSICVRVCLQNLAEGPAGETRVEIDMLTGYQPVMEDVEAMVHGHMVKSAAYIQEREVIVAVFKKVSSEDRTSCVAFRAVDFGEVARPTPASVSVTETEEQDPSCVLKYHAPLGQPSLQVYCADFTHLNRGECRCYSGICSSCVPFGSNELQLYGAQQLVCKAHVGYQVQVKDIQDRNQWLEIEAQVLSLNKTGSHKITANDHITLITPSSCSCPMFYNKNRTPLYMLSRDVEKMVDRRGRQVHRYILDENSVFLRVAHPERVTQSPSVPHWFMQHAFSKNNQC